VDQQDEKERGREEKSLQRHSIGHGVITSYRSRKLSFLADKWIMQRWIEE